MTAIEDLSDFKNLKLDEAGDIDVEKRVISVSEMATTLKEISESIKTVGYEGPLLNESEFSKAIADGPKSIEYTKLVSFLTNEIRVLRGLDECVNAICTPEDSATFIMEISSFLNELGCPYSWLTQGHVSDRFSSEQDKMLLLEYLSLETLMARIHRQRNPGKKIDLKLQESSQAADARKMLQTFGFAKPPANVTMKTLMEKLLPKVKSAIEKAGPELLGHPILNATLTSKKWELLNDIQQDLHSDFRIRREMLLKRLDCTIQSFQWSNKTKGKEDLVNQVYTEQRKLLKAEPDIDISDLLAGRDDLAIIEKTSSASVRKNTKSSINSVIIGQVPDRGGRTSEQAPPPPEMPSWQQRNTGPGSGGGFRGGRGGGQQNSFGGRGGGQQSSFGGRGGGQQSSFGGRGGGQQSSFGGGNSFLQSGSTFSSTGRGSSYYQSGSNAQSGNSYARDSSYNKGGDSYRSDSNTTRGSFDSAGSYGRSDSYSSFDNKKGNTDNYSQGNYSSKSTGYSFSGGYSSARDTSYSSGRDASYSGRDASYSSKDSGFSSKSSGNYFQSNSGSRGSFDSAGSYGGYSQDSKRAKTFDQYQPNKTTYADQYVEESSRNKQFHARGDSRSSGSGRSNYSRGGGSSYR